MTNLWQKVIKKSWDLYSIDVGKSLIHLGAVGWLFSSLAQVVMIASNKDIDKKEKKFLIPQETSDMAINVGLYYTICQFIKSLGDNAIESGKLITQKTADLIKSMNIKSVKSNDVIKGIANELKTEGLLETNTSKDVLSNLFDGITKVFEKKTLMTQNSKIKPYIDELLKNKTPEEALNLIKSAKEEFSAFKNGFGVMTAVGASILACNVITPIVRNKTANYYQKMAIKRQQPLASVSHESNSRPIQKTTYITTSINPVFSNFRI